MWIQVQLEEDGGSSTEQSWMREERSVACVFHWQQQGLNQFEACSKLGRSEGK